MSSLRTVAAPRPGPRRWIVVAGVLNFMCYIFTYNGTEGTHRYYFARDKYTLELSTNPREDNIREACYYGLLMVESTY